MKLNLQVVKTLVAVLFGGKSATEAPTTLTAEQKAQLTENFGEEFANNYEAAVSPDAGAETFEALRASLEAHYTGEATKSLAEAQKQLDAANAEIEKQKKFVAALSAKPEDDPEILEPTPTASASKAPIILAVDKNMSIYRDHQAYMRNGGLMADQGRTIDVSDLNKEFGKLLSTGANNMEVVGKIFNGFTSARHFKVVPATDRYRASQAEVNSVVQQFTNRWTPKGNSKFTPLEIINRRHKINVPIIPSEVGVDYLFHLYNESLSPDQMPITKWIIDNLILPQVLDDIELRMIAKGKFIATSDPTEATDPEDGMDGLETILVAQKALGTASKMKFVTGFDSFDWDTATPEEILEFVNAIVQQVNPLYKNKRKKIYMSNENIAKYQHAYKVFWARGAGIAGDFGDLKVDYSVDTLVGLDCLIGSPIVFSTTENNMVRLQHINTPPRIINDVQKHDYEVRLYGEFWLAVGFKIAEAVTSWVPAGYDPSAKLLELFGDSNEFSDGTTPRPSIIISPANDFGRDEDTGSSAGGV